MTDTQRNVSILRNLSLLAGLQAGLIVPLVMAISHLDWYATPVYFGALVFVLVSNAAFAVFLFLCTNRVAKRIENREPPAPVTPTSRKLRYGNAVLQVVLGGAWVGVDLGTHSWARSDVLLGVFFLLSGLWELWTLYRTRA